MKKRLLMVAVLSLALAWALALQAEESQPDPQKRPVIETSAAELNALSQSDEGLEVVRRPDGGEMVDLQGRFQMYAKVVMVDGKPYYTCQSHPGLHADMHKHVQVAKPVERAVK